MFSISNRVASLQSQSVKTLESKWRALLQFRNTHVRIATSPGLDPDLRLRYVYHPGVTPPLLQGQFKVGRASGEPGLVALTLQKI